MYSSGGNTVSDASRDRAIITAVSSPYAARIGIGARASKINPVILVVADRIRKHHRAIIQNFPILAFRNVRHPFPSARYRLSS